MDDVGDDTLDVAMTFSEVLGVGGGGSEVSLGVQIFRCGLQALEKSASDGSVARAKGKSNHRPRDIVRRWSMQPKPPSETHDRRARTEPRALAGRENRGFPCRSLRRKTRRSIAEFGRDDAHLPVLGGALALVGVAGENQPAPYATADNATHREQRRRGRQGQDAALSLRWERRVEMFVGVGARPTPMRGSRGCGVLTTVVRWDASRAHLLERWDYFRAVKGHPGRGHRIYEKAERVILGLGSEKQSFS